MSYSREITLPKTKQEGLSNVVQMIINLLERGESHEALLVTVDLLDDVSGKADPYELTAEKSKKIKATAEVVRKELQAKHEAELAKMQEVWFAAGRDAMRKEIMQKLGL